MSKEKYYITTAIAYTSRKPHIGNFSGFSWFSKLVLSADMIIGRLEIFPVLALFSPSLWKRCN